MRASLRQFLVGARVSLALTIADLNPWIVLGVDIPRALLQALFFVLMAEAAGGGTQARFALIGNGVMVAVQTAILYMGSVIEGEKWAGTLTYWIASPSRWLPTMLGRGAAEFSRAMLTSALVFCILVPFIAPNIHWLNMLRAVPLILLTLTSAGTLGWLVGAVALPVRWGTMFANVMAYCMMVLCGVNFPVSNLPAAVQLIGRLIPVTNGLLAIRGVIDGASYASVLPWVGGEVGIALVFGTAAWLVFGYRLQILRRGGNLDLV